MSNPPHQSQDRRRLNRSREGNVDIVVDRRALLSLFDDNGFTDEVTRVRSTRLSLDTQPRRAPAPAATADIEPQPSTSAGPTPWKV